MTEQASLAKMNPARPDVPVARQRDLSVSRDGKWKPSWSDMALLGCLTILAVAAPFLGGFYMYVFTLAGIYAIVALGNNLLLSHGGLVSIGQGGLLAIGCYVYAFAARAGWPVPFIVILSTTVAALSGLLIGLPALRLSGHYLALVTLSFAIAVAEVIIVFDDYTGGTSGIPIAANTLSPIANFYAILAVTALAAISQSRLLASRFGLALRLMRDSERAAAAIGINIAKYKLAAFVYSGVLAGLAGTFFVSATGYLTPTMFDLWLSVYFLVAIVLGGMGPPAGAVFGATLIAIIPQLSSAYQGLSAIIFGFALLLVLFATRTPAAIQIGRAIHSLFARHA